VLEDGKFIITLKFIKDMIAWFKEGKTLPRRYAWEIILGAHSHFAEEETVVSVCLHDGMTCDVIGDVHGTTCLSHDTSTLTLQRRPILRSPSLVFLDWGTTYETLFTYEWRSCGSWVMVDRGYPHCFRIQMSVVPL
jgi:hypothetical protein